MEFVAQLKQPKTQSGTSSSAHQVLALARTRAEEMRGLPREQIVQRFNAAIERLRAQAIENDTAISSEHYGD